MAPLCQRRLFAVLKVQRVIVGSDAPLSARQMSSLSASSQYTNRHRRNKPGASQRVWCCVRGLIGLVVSYWGAKQSQAERSDRRRAEHADPPR